MSFLAGPDRKEIHRLFEQLNHDVWLIHFTQECETCNDTRLLLEEVTSLSDKLHLKIHDFVTDNALAKKHGIDRVPALVISSEATKGKPRYFGMPAGYEFSNLLSTLIEASTVQTELGVRARETVAAIDKDVHIQVFVTPSCQYCAPVARLAHQIAVENPHVTADIIEINEFADLAQRYRILGVPKTVINDSVDFTGAVTEEQFLEHLNRAI